MKRRVSLVLLGWGLACAGPAPVEVSEEVTEEPAPAPQAARLAPPELRYAQVGEKIEFSRWDDLHSLYLGVDLANLRSSPSSSAPVVATLPMGEPLVVLETSSEEQSVLERVNRWYRVRAGKSEGHMFGSLLTPLVHQVDLDGDSEEEWISVTFGPDFVPRVRVMEPRLPVEEDRMVGLDLSMPKLSKGGTVMAKVVPAPDGAWALLEVEMCEDRVCVKKLVSYLREPGKVLGQLAEIPGDPDKLDFSQGGITFGRQTLWPVGGRFVAASSEGAVGETWKAEVSEHIVSLELESVGRGPSTDVPCSTLGKVSSGAHRGKTLMSCVVSQPGKGGPDERYLFRFVKQDDSYWIYLPRASSTQSWAYDLVLAAAQALEIDIRVDADTAVRGLELPETLMEGPWGSLSLEYSADDGWSGGKILGVHPQHGVLYGNLQGEGAVFLPQPEGNYLVYNYRLGDWVKAAAGDYHVRTGHCGNGPSLYAQVMEVPSEQLKVHASSPDGQQLFALLEYEEEGIPFLLWKDPFGRLVEVLRSDLQPPDLCEPVLYLYGTDEPVTVTLDPDISVMVSAPRLEGSGWTLLPTGDGGVRVPGSERTWPYLFWEGQSGLFDRPAHGEVVARGEVRGYLRGVLPAHGLMGREIDDFVRSWAPKLEQSPFVRVSFHEREDIDEIVPMTIEPAPDTLVRVMMEYEPLDGPAPSSPGRAPALAPRRGFTVVEWGGVVR